MMKKRINGQQLGQNVGEEVILLGSVKRVSPNGKSLELLTTDDKIVNVSLMEPIDGTAEGYIEIHGTAQSKSTVACSSFVHFPSEMLEDFDSEQYNQLLSILTLLGSKKWKMSATDEPL